MAIHNVTPNLFASKFVPETNEPQGKKVKTEYVNPFGGKETSQQALATQGTTTPYTVKNPKTNNKAIFNRGVSLPNNFDKFSNYLRNTSQLFGTYFKAVNEYDAAINSALKYLPSPGDLETVANSLPSIRAILSQKNLPVNMNYKNLKTIKNTHLSTTIEFSRAIGKELGMSNEELETMEVGAALHDLGKSLIPEEILNKNGKLDPEERSIINLHSTLGYELLKGLGFGTNVAEISRDHHNPNSKNKMAQIVRAADVYSAMREERPYKTAKTHDEAMAVLKTMNIKQEILNALDKNYGKTTSQVETKTTVLQLQPLMA